jgi:cell division protein FtsL
MENVMRLTQAYSQAPWRKQIQMIVFFLLVLVMVALVAGIYLSVSARAVAAGVEIQTIEQDIEAKQQAIQDLETELALMTSSSVMEERAQDIGLEPIGPDRIEYIEVPGYPGRQGPTMAPPPEPSVVTSPGLSSEFTESLIEWFVANVLRPSGLLEVGQ